MTELERIGDQLDRAFNGNAWHGPAVKEILSEVTAEQAAAKPVARAHSIWEITLHIAAWLGACRKRLEGDAAQLPQEEDWPPVMQTDDRSWAEVSDHLNREYEALRSAILSVDESRLEAPIVTGMSSVYVTLHGAVQHSLYHAGQIATLKKSFDKGN